MPNMEVFLSNNWGTIITILLAYFLLILPIQKYLQDRRLQEKDIRFRNYHELIDRLVGAGGKAAMLDRQIAIIYELRNFKDYYPVTLRILKGLKEKWGDNRVSDEINLTISHIESSKIYRKSKNK
jgi:hypothetical protein